MGRGSNECQREHLWRPHRCIWSPARSWISLGRGGQNSSGRTKRPRKLGQRWDVEPTHHSWKEVESTPGMLWEQGRKVPGDGQNARERPLAGLVESVVCEQCYALDWRRRHSATQPTVWHTRIPIQQYWFQKHWISSLIFYLRLKLFILIRLIL